MKALWFASTMIFILTSCNNFICRKVQTEDTVNLRILSGFSDSSAVRKFRATIMFRNTSLTGILVYKQLNDSTSAGSFINEFGLKGFDFSVAQNGARLGYIFQDLNKLYIRKSLETDLHFIFLKPKLLTTCLINNTVSLVTSIKRSLHYVYYSTENKYIEQADLYKRAHKISTLTKYYNESGGLVIKMNHNDSSLSYELNEIIK